MTKSKPTAVEWPTIAVLTTTYALWALAVFWIADMSVVLAVPLVALAVAQHASLTHEAIHGHPFRSQRMNAALVWPAIGVLFPYGRFRATHLAHHADCELTDPYDDPESNFLTPEAWNACPALVRRVLTWNNTLLGRLIMGPLIGTVAFIRTDLKLARTDPDVIKHWLLHLPPLATVLVLVAFSPVPVWVYLLATYIGHSLIRIRTFLEHRAHENARGRSVIIEDRGPLAFLFLNNNLHAVHHMHPRVPWYRLPALYRARRDRFLLVNEGYCYHSYAEVFRQHLLAVKDPVAHPHYHQE